MTKRTHGKWLILGLVGLCLAQPLVAQEPRSCARMGCENGVNLQFETVNDGWPAGSYVMDFRLDGKRIRCRGRLPLKACGQPSMACDGNQVQVIESGCALPKNQQGWGGVRIDSEISQLEAKISLNGRALGRVKQAIQYQTLQPNGPECGPTCRFAEIKMKLTLSGPSH